MRRDISVDEAAVAAPSKAAAGAIGGHAGRAGPAGVQMPVWTHVMRLVGAGGRSPARADAEAFEYLARETDAPIARLAPGAFAFASTVSAPVPVERLARRLGADLFGSETAVVVEAIAAVRRDAAVDRGREIEPAQVVADMRAALGEAREVTRRLALDAAACVAAAGRSATALEIRCDDAVRRVMEAFEEGRRELRPQGVGADVARLERAAAEVLRATAERAAVDPEVLAAAVAETVRGEVREAVEDIRSEMARLAEEVAAAARRVKDGGESARPDARLDDVHAALRTLAVALGGRLDADARDREAVQTLAHDVRSLVAGLAKLGGASEV